MHLVLALSKAPRHTGKRLKPTLTEGDLPGEAWLTCYRDPMLSLTADLILLKLVSRHSCKLRQT